MGWAAWNDRSGIRSKVMVPRSELWRIKSSSGPVEQPLASNPIPTNVMVPRLYRINMIC